MAYPYERKWGCRWQVAGGKWQVEGTQIGADATQITFSLFPFFVAFFRKAITVNTEH